MLFYIFEEDESQQQQMALVIVSFDPSHLYFFNGLFASQNVRNHKTYISLVDSRLSTYLPMSIQWTTSKVSFSTKTKVKSNLLLQGKRMLLMASFSVKYIQIEVQLFLNQRRRRKIVCLDFCFVHIDTASWKS